MASGLGSTVGGGSYAIEGGFLPGADMPNPMAVLLLEYLLGRRSLNAEERQQADVNRDGQIDAADLIASLKI